MKTQRLFVSIVFLVILLTGTKKLHADTYTYDPLNRLTRVTYDDGSSINYTYDAAGNITQIGTAGNQPTPVDGACGSSNGGTFSTTPADSYCSSGNVSGLTGTGPWSWKCDGSYGGQQATCMAYLQNQSTLAGTISINSGAQYTNNPLVNLAIVGNGPNGVAEMCISQTPLCTNWLPYNPAATILLNGGSGSRTVNLWFRDSVGLANGTPSASASIILDTTAPTLTLSMLDDGAVSRENLVNVTGVAKDIGSGISWVKVNGNPVEFNATNGVFSYPLPLIAASTAITVTTADMAGNTATATRSINRDLAAPVLTIDTPTDYSATNVALMTISGTVEAGAAVNVLLNGILPPVAALVTGTSYTAQVTLSSATTLNTIQVTATGLSGKSSSAKRSIRYISTRWIMEVTDPPQDALTTAGSYLLKGRIANVANAPLTITITRGTDTYTPTVTNGTFEQLVTLPTNGLHAFSVLGTDSLGNKSSVTRVLNKGDFELPVITQFSMPATSTSFLVPLTFSATDNAGITGWCESFTFITPDACVWSSTPPTSHTFKTQGNKTLYGYVKDAAGNIASATANTVVTVADQSMTVTVNGTGKGTVTSDPVGISCISGSSAGCSAAFSAGSTMSLLQIPQSDSVFGGWSGDCSGTGACSNPMTATKTVTATFNLAPKVMIGTSGYATLGNAYSAAPASATIKVLDAQFSESLTLNLDKNIILDGGYYTDFINRSGLKSVLKGRLTIQKGSLRVDRLIIR